MSQMVLVIAHASDDRWRVLAESRGVVAGDRDADRRDLGARERAGASNCLGVDDIAGSQRVRPGAQLVEGRRGHPPERDRLAVTAEVGEGDALEHREREAASAKRPRKGVARARVDHVLPASDDAGLRSAEELVAGERDRCRARLERLPRGSLAPHPRRGAVGQPGAGGIEEARADVDDHGRAERRERVDLDALGEALDAVVRRVDFQDQGNVGVRIGRRSLVVGEPGAIRRADIDKSSARLGHDLRNPEASADLHRLAARDHHVAASPERGEHEQHRRGTVVHDERGLSTARSRQEASPRGRDASLGVRSRGRARG